MSVLPTPGGGAGCPIILAGTVSTLILATSGAVYPDAVPLAIRLLLFVAIAALCGSLAALGWRFAATTPVPVPSGKDSAS